MTSRVTVCVPTIRRYDLLRQLCLSLQSSTMPASVMVIDNGRNERAITDAIRGMSDIHVHTPSVPLGVAASWNWFVERVPEERIISNDDITFSSDSVEKIVGTKADLVFAHGFSCFLIRDRCIGLVGFFDEELSPGYAYFEDCDYSYRVGKQCAKGPHVVMANAESNGVEHVGSQTWQAGNGQEVAEHWRRFDIAKANYVRKWGGLPKEETL